LQRGGQVEVIAQIVVRARESALGGLLVGGTKPTGV